MNFSYVNLATLFRKLKKDKIKLKRLVKDEEGDKKNKIITLKVEEWRYSNTNEDITLLFIKFKNFIKHDNQQSFQHKNEGKSLFVPTCF